MLTFIAALTSAIVIEESVQVFHSLLFHSFHSPRFLEPAVSDPPTEQYPFFVIYSLAIALVSSR